MIKKSNIKFIDLDLPSKTLWSDKYLGAYNKFSPGLYYQWGELKGYRYNKSSKNLPSWDEYKFGGYCSSEDDGITKYNRVDDLNILQPEDDIVTLTFGKNYKIPEKKDFEELLKYTYKKYSANNDNNTISIFTSNINNKNLYFPINGRYGVFGHTLKNESMCWTSTLGDYETAIIFTDTEICRLNRSFAINIRPIYVK